jgi:predicted O-methyltransferase YrrM
MRHITPYLDLFTETARTFGDVSRPIRILEVGVYVGSSTMAFVSGILEREGKGKLVSIDIKDYGAHVLRKAAAKDLDMGSWTFIPGDSKNPEIISRASEEIGGEVDILFVDGDHRYEGVKADAENFLPLVRSGGIAFFHDVGVEKTGVPKWWSEVNPEDWVEKREENRKPGTMGILYKR